MARIAVAVSGGADSLFALVYLKEQGHDLVALHGLFLPNSTNTTAMALSDICTKLNISLHVLDLRTKFDQLIVEPFIKAYAKGLTPNPCAICNKHIKFGLLMQEALQLNAEFFATGHYAKINTKPHIDPSISPLAKGADKRKEQSYFLSLVPKAILEKCIFPLEDKEKTFIVQYLEEKGFSIPLSKESQEICFVPSDAYRPFLQDEAKKRCIKLSGPGPMVLEENGIGKNLGKHKGLWQYTEGQRRGLNIAHSEPLYVRAKDLAQNTLILGTASQLALNGCIVHKLNILAPVESWPNHILVRVRYRQQETRALCTFIDDRLRIEFTNPQSPTACGQVATLYDTKGNVLAGGLIESIF